MARAFDSKDQARHWVWDHLQDEGVARFPFPPHHRIPNFAGAEQAAQRLLEDAIFVGVERIKANPDAPQLPVRALALEAGITVVVPTPRLRGGFKELDPSNIPEGEHRRAASLSHMDDYAQPVGLEELAPVDLVVTGSVAVTRGGARCGKGEGYGDLEVAILQELGHVPVPVATTVHPLQIVEGLPQDATDLHLARIATRDQTLDTGRNQPAVARIDWTQLDEDRLDEMPVLRSLRPLPS